MLITITKKHCDKILTASFLVLHEYCDALKVKLILYTRSGSI